MAQGRQTSARKQYKNELSARNADEPDACAANHHLWRNGRLWWVAFTVHLPGWQKERIRISLGTDDVYEARRRRDEILKHYPAARGCELSLRITPPRGRGPGATPSRRSVAA